MKKSKDFEENLRCEVEAEICKFLLTCGARARELGLHSEADMLTFVRGAILVQAYKHEEVV